MSKAKRSVIGSVLKSKVEGELDYINISGFHKDKLIEALNKLGTNDKLVLRLQNSASIKKSVQFLTKNNKISSEVAESLLKKAEGIPDYVRFEIVMENT